jgi:hypothetical protein
MLRAIKAWEASTSSINDGGLIIPLRKITAAKRITIHS